jgi:ribonuclease P protein component
VENKIRSLTKRADFENLRASGHSIHVNSWLLVNTQKTDSGEMRLGWTISRYTGSAVVRNRLRRWGREYLRKWRKGNRLGLDLNLIFKRKEKGFYKALSHEEFDGALDKLVSKLERTLK